MPETKPVIPPAYNRPGNIQRKMELVLRYIAELKRTQDYYGHVFVNDPWFADRLREAEATYAELEAAFKKALKGLGSEEQIQEACRYVAQKYPAARMELTKERETKG